MRIVKYDTVVVNFGLFIILSPVFFHVLNSIQQGIPAAQLFPFLKFLGANPLLCISAIVASVSVFIFADSARVFVGLNFTTVFYAGVVQNLDKFGKTELVFFILYVMVYFVLYILWIQEARASYYNSQRTEADMATDSDIDIVASVEIEGSEVWDI